MKIPTPASDQARQWGLLSRREDERHAAEQAIHKMGPDAIPFLLQVIEEQSRITRRWRRLYLFHFLVLVACYFFVSLVCLFSLYSPGLGCLFITLFTVLMIGILFQLERASTRLQDRAGVLFAQRATPELIGPLVELLESSEGEVFQTICKGLTRLFLKLQASDSAYLTTSHRKILAQQLLRLAYSNEEEGPAFAMALLHALKQVGDPTFIEPVRRLLYQNEYAIGTDVHAAARECLPYLEAFAQQEQKSGTLVRSASAPDEQASALLLRPAGAGAASEPTVLLRSVDQGKAE